jgi:hypothetical protein
VWSSFYVPLVLARHWHVRHAIIAAAISQLYLTGNASRTNENR